MASRGFLVNQNKPHVKIYNFTSLKSMFGLYSVHVPATRGKISELINESIHDTNDVSRS